MTEMLDNAQGCLLGQLVGDALGSIVEFMPESEILKQYPNRVTELISSPVWNTLPGQPTDDSEMALMLARSLVKNNKFDVDHVRSQYEYWLQSKPFDFGTTTFVGIMGDPDYNSQANGSLMRVSPLGIFGANYTLDEVNQWAMEDSSITHPNKICKEVSALYAMAISYSISNSSSPRELYDNMVSWAEERDMDITVKNCISNAELFTPPDFQTQMGWVLIAFQNALYQLLHADTFEEAIIDTVMRGGDTDTNGAICGALLGSVYGIDAIPKRWVDVVLECKATPDDISVKHARPECFWANDALLLASGLIRKENSNAQT